jgi:hypothetical protein
LKGSASGFGLEEYIQDVQLELERTLQKEKEDAVLLMLGTLLLLSVG